MVNDNQDFFFFFFFFDKSTVKLYKIYIYGMLKNRVVNYKCLLKLPFIILSYQTALYIYLFIHIYKIIYMHCKYFYFYLFIYLLIFFFFCFLEGDHIKNMEYIMRLYEVKTKAIDVDLLKPFHDIH